MKSILFEAMDFIKTVESNSTLISNPQFAENAHEIFNKLLTVDTQSAIDFDDWVKVQLNNISK